MLQLHWHIIKVSAKASKTGHKGLMFRELYIIVSRRVCLWVCCSVCLSAVFLKNAPCLAVLEAEHNVLLCGLSERSSRIAEPDLMTSVMPTWNLASWKFQMTISLEWVVRSLRIWS